MSRGPGRVMRTLLELADATPPLHPDGRIAGVSDEDVAVALYGGPGTRSQQQGIRRAARALAADGRLWVVMVRGRHRFRRTGVNELQWYRARYVRPMPPQLAWRWAMTELESASLELERDTVRTMASHGWDADVVGRFPRGGRSLSFDTSMSYLAWLPGVELPQWRPGCAPPLYVCPGSVPTQDTHTGYAGPLLHHEAGHTYDLDLEELQ